MNNRLDDKADFRDNNFLLKNNGRFIHYKGNSNNIIRNSSNQLIEKNSDLASNKISVENINKLGDIQQDINIMLFKNKLMD